MVRPSQHLHERHGLAHRDLKPDNILFDMNGGEAGGLRAFLIDYDRTRSRNAVQERITDPRQCFTDPLFSTMHLQEDKKARTQEVRAEALDQADREQLGLTLFEVCAQSKLATTEHKKYAKRNNIITRFTSTGLPTWRLELLDSITMVQRRVVRLLCAGQELPSSDAERGNVVEQLVWFLAYFSLKMGCPPQEFSMVANRAKRRCKEWPVGKWETLPNAICSGISPPFQTTACPIKIPAKCAKNQ